MGIILYPFRREYNIDPDDKKKIKWLKTLTIVLVAIPIIVGLVNSMVLGLLSSWWSVIDHPTTIFLTVFGLFLIPIGGFIGSRAKVASYIYWITNLVFYIIAVVTWSIYFVIMLISWTWGTYWPWIIVQTIYIFVFLIVFGIMLILQYRYIVDIYLGKGMITEKPMKLSERTQSVYETDLIKSIILFIINVIMALMALIVIYFIMQLSTTLGEPSIQIMWIVVLNFIICGFVQYFLEHEGYPGLQTYLAFFFIVLLLIQIGLIVTFVIIITIAEVTSCGKWVCASPIAEKLGYWAWGFAIAGGCVDVILVVYGIWLAVIYGRNANGLSLTKNSNSETREDFGERFMGDNVPYKKRQYIKNVEKLLD